MEFTLEHHFLGQLRSEYVLCDSQAKHCLVASRLTLLSLRLGCSCLVDDETLEQMLVLLRRSLREEPDQNGLGSVAQYPSEAGSHRCLSLGVTFLICLQLLDSGIHLQHRMQASLDPVLLLSAVLLRDDDTVVCHGVLLQPKEESGYLRRVACLRGQSVCDSLAE